MVKRFNPWLVLSYVTPQPKFWERLHSRPNYWNYSEGHYAPLLDYLKERDELSSVLDLACNEGYFLQNLSRWGRFSRMAGLDVSRNVVTRAQQRVAALEAYHFDLCHFFQESPPLPEGLGCFDLCVLSDVLYYMAPFQISPYLYWDVMPLTWDLPRKRRVLEHCRRLTRKLLIVSAHQDLPSIRYLLETTPGMKLVLPGFYALETT